MPNLNENDLFFLSQMIDPESRNLPCRAPGSGKKWFTETEKWMSINRLKSNEYLVGDILIDTNKAFDYSNVYATQTGINRLYMAEL